MISPVYLLGDMNKNILSPCGEFLEILGFFFFFLILIYFEEDCLFVVSGNIFMLSCHSRGNKSLWLYYYKILKDYKISII